MNKLFTKIYRTFNWIYFQEYQIDDYSFFYVMNRINFWVQLFHRKKFTLGKSSKCKNLLTWKDEIIFKSCTLKEADVYIRLNL